MRGSCFLFPIFNLCTGNKALDDDGVTQWKEPGPLSDRMEQRPLANYDDL